MQAALLTLMSGRDNIDSNRSCQEAITTEEWATDLPLSTEGIGRRLDRRYMGNKDSHFLTDSQEFRVETRSLICHLCPSLMAE